MIVRGFAIFEETYGASGGYRGATLRAVALTKDRAIDLAADMAGAMALERLKSLNRNGSSESMTVILPAQETFPNEPSRACAARDQLRSFTYLQRVPESPPTVTRDASPNLAPACVSMTATQTVLRRTWIAAQVPVRIADSEETVLVWRWVGDEAPRLGTETASAYLKLEPCDIDIGGIVELKISLDLDILQTQAVQDQKSKGGA